MELDELELDDDFNVLGNTTTEESIIPEDLDNLDKLNEDEPELEDLGIDSIIDEEVISDFSTSLLKLAELGIDELPEGLELKNDSIITKDIFEQVVSHNINSIKEKTVQETEQALLAPLSEKLIEAIKFEHSGGNIDTFLKLYNKIEDVSALNPDTDDDAERIVMEYYRGTLSEEEAKDIVLGLAEANRLTSKAKELQPKLIESNQKQLTAEAEASAKVKEFYDGQEAMLMNTFTKVIKDDTTFKFSQNEAIDIFNTLFEDVEVNYGKDPLGKDIVKTQKKYEYFIQRLLRDPQANKQKLLEVAMLLDPENKFEKVLNRKRIEQVTKDIITTQPKSTNNKTNRFGLFKTKK